MPKGPKGEKRPRDVSQRAKLIVDIATGEVEDENPDKEEGCCQKVVTETTKKRSEKPL